MANLYNGERYVDPTAFQALSNIEREQRKARRDKARSQQRKTKRRANREAKKVLKPEPTYRPATSIRTLSTQENTAVLLSIRELSR